MCVEYFILYRICFGFKVCVNHFNNIKEINKSLRANIIFLISKILFVVPYYIVYFVNFVDMFQNNYINTIISFSFCCVDGCGNWNVFDYCGSCYFIYNLVNISQNLYKKYKYPNIAVNLINSYWMSVLHFQRMSLDHHCLYLTDLVIIPYHYLLVVYLLIDPFFDVFDLFHVLVLTFQNVHRVLYVSWNYLDYYHHLEIHFVCIFS